MEIPPIPLFDWLLRHAPHAHYVLSFSNTNGLTYGSFIKYTGFNISNTFDLGLNSHYGYDGLRTTLADMYETKPERIVTTSGGSEANFLVFYSMLRPSDDVIVERPGYQPLWLTPQSLGANIIFCDRDPNDSFSVDINALQECLTARTRLIILTNLHNPTGTYLSNDVVKQVSNLAKDSNCSVLIDEIFLDGCFTPRPSAAGLPHIIVTSSMTKIYGLGGLRSGWIIASKEQAEQFQTAKAHTTVGSSMLSEHMCAAVLQHAREQLKSHFLVQAKTNFKTVKTWVLQNKHIVDWIEPHGGLFCFIRYHSLHSSEQLCVRLVKEKGVLVCPGSFFGLDGFFRLSYNCDPNKLQEALERIKEFLELMAISRN
jgi:aspartate/methionine/tyrosine aminotransferase